MRPEKTLIVADVREKLKSSPYLLLVDYSGMKVLHFEELRTRLAGAAARLSVVRNTFLKIAAKDLQMPELDSLLTGQTAMITGEADICAAAKILKTFAAEFKKPVVRAGVLDNAPLTADQVAELADLPSKEALQAKFLGLLQTPASQFVRLLNEPAASLARILQAKADAMPEAAAQADAPEVKADASEVQADAPEVKTDAPEAV
jgi:large subunit ribosomal protein L10